MSLVQSPFLRRLIAIDAVACLASGGLLAFAAGPLAAVTGLSPALTRPAGIFLLAWSLLLAGLATRPALPRGVVWALVAVNAAWAVESGLLLALGWASPTPAGYGFVIVQALAVAALAELQVLALRRAPRLA